MLLQILTDQWVGGIPTHDILEHCGRHMHRDAAQLANAGINGPFRQVHLTHALSQRKGGGREDIGRDLADLADDGRQTYTGEDKDVVALPDPELLPLVAHVLEGTTGRHDRLALAPAVDIFRQRFTVCCGVGEREYHGALAMFQH